MEKRPTAIALGNESRRAGGDDLARKQQAIVVGRNAEEQALEPEPVPPEQADHCPRAPEVCQAVGYLEPELEGLEQFFVLIHGGTPCPVAAVATPQAGRDRWP